MLIFATSLIIFRKFCGLKLVVYRGSTNTIKRYYTQGPRHGGGVLGARAPCSITMSRALIIPELKKAGYHNINTGTTLQLKTTIN